MKRVFILVFLVLLFLEPAVSQIKGNNYLNDRPKRDHSFGTEAGFKKNILKIDPGKLIIGGISLSYERVLSPGASVNFRAQYHSLGFIERGIGDFSTTGENYTFGLTRRPDFYALSFDAEYRFYLKKKRAARGFYVAPYARYMNYTGKFESLYTGTLANQPVSTDGNLKIAFDIRGGAIQFGSQWMIKDKVSIDWGFAGVGLDNYTFKIGVQSDNLGNTIDQYTHDLQDVLGGVNGFLAKKTAFNNVIKNELSSDVSFWMIGWKSFLTVGISF